MLHAVFAFLLLLMPSAAHGFYKAEYANDPARSEWFQSLKDCNGSGCCGMADGEPYYNNYTENADGSITLANHERIEGCQILRIKNPTGSALWFHNSVRTFCFVPGGGW